MTAAALVCLEPEIGTLNVGKITGRGGEVVKVMQRKNKINWCMVQTELLWS